MLSRAFFITIILLLSGCFDANTPQENIDKGQAATAKKQYTEAILYYKNALKERPADSKVHFELGTVYYAIGDTLNAERYLQDAYHTDYPADQVVPLLAAISFQQNNLLELKRLLKEQSSLDTKPTFTLQLSLFEVLVLARENNLGEAEKSLNTLKSKLGASSLNCELCLLTQAYIESYRAPTSAIKTLDKLLIEYPNSAQAYLLRGQLYFALHNPTEAMKNFVQFKRLQPKAGYVNFLLAITALQMKDIPTATKFINNLLVGNPQQPLVNHLKALLVFEQKDYRAAQQYAEQSINRGLKSPANHLMAGVSAFHLQQMEIAYGHLRKALASYPENMQLQRLVMLIQLKFGYLKEASENYIKQDIRSVQDVLSGNLMAYQFLKDGQFSEANSVLSYLKDIPISQPVIRLQTEALLNKLNLKETLSETEVAYQEKNLNTHEKLIHIIVLLESKSLNEAKIKADNWLKQAPKNIDALNILAYILQQLNREDKAESLFLRALEINPQNSPSLFFLAKQAQLKSEYKKASSYYRTILDAQPESLSALRALLKLTFTSQKSPNWDELLSLIGMTQITDDQIVATADAMLQWQQYEKLDTFLAHYKSKKQWSDMVWMVWLKNNYYLHGKGGFQSGFEEYYQINPLEVHVLYALSIIENHQNFALILKTIESLPEKMQTNDRIKMQKVLALIELNQFELVKDILSSFKDSSDFRAENWYIKGRLMEQKGDLDQAANYLSAYYESLPSFHSINRLVMVLIKANRSKEAASISQQYLNNHPTDNSANLSLALKLAPTHPAIALTLLESEQVQWLIWRNWKLSNNIAWLYLSQNKPEKALIYSTNAMALNPSSDQLKTLHSEILTQLNTQR